MLNYVILALSVSLDSLGIGFSYGLNRIKVLPYSKIILCIISISFTTISLFIGKYLYNFLSTSYINIISSLILSLIGIEIILDPIPFDLDSSKQIDIRESLLLGLTLSLDSACVGFSLSIGNSFSFLFPILVVIFQFCFISLGTKIGNKISNLNTKIPDTLFKVISGILLIIIGIFKM